MSEQARISTVNEKKNRGKKQEAHKHVHITKQVLLEKESKTITELERMLVQISLRKTINFMFSSSFLNFDLLLLMPLLLSLMLLLLLLLTLNKSTTLVGYQLTCFFSLVIVMCLGVFAREDRREIALIYAT